MYDNRPQCQNDVPFLVIGTVNYGVSFLWTIGALCHTLGPNGNKALHEQAADIETQEAPNSRTEVQES